jgi:tetratricopeptide (TPR) repeat protein
MKKLIFIYFFVIFNTAFSQNEELVILNCNKLISEKKYESAYKVLEEFDKKNLNIKIAILKSNILLKYFTSSIMHEIFSLVDIKPNEDISMYRGENGTFTMFNFSPKVVLNDLKKKHPNSCEIYNALGEYYYEVNLKYGDNWIEPEETLLKKINENFKKAIELNCEGYLAHYFFGLNELQKNNYKESVTHFLKSINKNNEYGSSHYNLAYAYLYLDERDSAIKYAKNAVILYSDSIYKADAYRMLGQIYTELKDDKNALENFQYSDKLDPKNYYNLKQILSIQVRSNIFDYKHTTLEFFNLDPDNPTILGDLENIYLNNKKGQELITFFNEQLESKKSDKKILGGLNFYLGKLTIKDDKIKAKAYFETSKIFFLDVFDKKHEVFEAIEEGINSCK